MVEKIINIMGGELYYYLNIKNEKLTNEILDFAIYETKKLVKIFNFFDKKSSLSILNKNKNLPTQEDLYYLLNEAIKFYEISNKKFNVFIGNEIKKRKLNKINNSKLIVDKNKNKNLDFNNIISFDNENINILNPEITIDLGGIAKGFIIDKVLERILKKYKKEIIDILIDARGDIVFFGRNDKIIEVENPFDNEIKFEEFKIKAGSVITSGHNKQKFKAGSHILGNKTDILTITLKSNFAKCYELDALGTYLIQLKSEEVLKKIEFVKYFENIECFLILNNGKILKSSFW